jgi:hypothetical protein
MEVVWPSDPSPSDESSFTMVLLKGTPHNLPNAKLPQLLSLIRQLGFGLAPCEEVDSAAAEANRDGLLKFGPAFLNSYSDICASRVIGRAP